MGPAHPSPTLIQRWSHVCRGLCLRPPFPSRQNSNASAPSSDPCRRSLGARSSGPLRRRADRAKCGTSFPLLPHPICWQPARRFGGAVIAGEEEEVPASRRATSRGRRPTAPAMPPAGRRLSVPPWRQWAIDAPVSREPLDPARSSEYLGLGTEGGHIFASSCTAEKKTLSFYRLLLLSEFWSLVLFASLLCWVVVRMSNVKLMSAFLLETCVCLPEQQPVFWVLTECKASLVLSARPTSSDFFQSALCLGDASPCMDFLKNIVYHDITKSRSQSLFCLRSVERIGLRLLPFGRRDFSDISANLSV
jgi:hypothetical protein